MYPCQIRPQIPWQTRDSEEEGRYLCIVVFVLTCTYPGHRCGFAKTGNWARDPKIRRLRWTGFRVDIRLRVSKGCGPVATRIEFEARGRKTAGELN